MGSSRSTVSVATTNTPETTPNLGQELRVSITNVTDADNASAGNPTGAITGPVAYTWQVEPSPGTGVFEDIGIAVGGILGTATGPTFTVTAAEVGLVIRVRAVYQDSHGVLETVFSGPSEAVAIPDATPVGTVLISDTTPTESLPLAATPAFTDANGLAGVVFNFEWQSAIAVGAGGGASGFADIVGATADAFTPTQAEVNRELRVVVTYIDNAGFAGTVILAATTVTGDFLNGNGAANTFNGTEGADIAFGNGGNDVLNGNGGNDQHRDRQRQVEQHRERAR